MTSRATPPRAGPRSARAAGHSGRPRVTRAQIRRRRSGCALSLLVSLVAFIALGYAIVAGAGSLGRPVETGPRDISGIPEASVVPWTGPQADYGVDVSYPQCGRTLRDMGDGYVIVGLDGGMPDRPNPCFASQWGFALRQSGAAVYVNTADDGRGDPVKEGRRNARDDLRALAAAGVAPGTPVWLDVELPEVWRGSQARHRAVITAHLSGLAEGGFPVGIYSAPALWREITGGAPVSVPTWVGIGTARRERAGETCRAESFGARMPAIVQRIGTGSDGRPLDRNLTCPGTDLTGLVRPA